MTLSCIYICITNGAFNIFTIQGLAHEDTWKTNKQLDWDNWIGLFRLCIFYHIRLYAQNATTSVAVRSNFQYATI